MNGYARWQDIRKEHVERAGGEEAVRTGKEEMLAAATGRRPAELRGVAERTGPTKGRGSQHERGRAPGQ